VAVCEFASVVWVMGLDSRRFWNQELWSAGQVVKITGFSDFVHGLVFQKLENTFQKLDLFPSSGEGETPTL
jgi:hypothetical protein